MVSMGTDTRRSFPINQRPYRIPLQKRQIVDQEMLMDSRPRDAYGIIESSSSPWASPIKLVPKKDGTTIFCIDYLKLNAVTKKDAYPLPYIQEIFDNLGGACLFSTLDLESGYWQVPVSVNSREKTAFVTHRGLFSLKGCHLVWSMDPLPFSGL